MYHTMVSCSYPATQVGARGMVAELARAAARVDRVVMVAEKARQGVEREMLTFVMSRRN